MLLCHLSAFACPAKSGRLLLTLQRARISANPQEDKEFLRSFFAAQDAKGLNSACQHERRLVGKDFFFRDDTDHYIPNVHEFHREVQVKQTKKLDSGTKKSVNATLDMHAHHNFMRQDSMKGKRGNAAAARLQQDHISDSHSSLGTSLDSRPLTRARPCPRAWHMQHVSTDSACCISHARCREENLRAARFSQSFRKGQGG